MIVEKIEYTNYFGEKKVKEARFHLTKPELIELQVDKEGGFDKYIQRISEAENQKEIIEVFKRIVYMAYGVVSDDGDRFIKSKEVKDAFVESPAYEALYMKLATNADEAAKFFNGMMPNDLDKPAIAAVK